MATTRSFNSMLNEYLTYDLLMAELEKRNYILENVEKDDKWRGGNLVVPFQGASASSFAYGSLTDVTDIAENLYVRGGVSGYKEIWGTMKWNARDLEEHGGGSGIVSEQSFLKNLPGMIEDFIDNMKQVVSVNLLVGQHYMKLTADATANNGTIVVDRVERTWIGQKLIIKDSVNTFTTYVKSININTNTVIVATDRTYVTVTDFSAGGGVTVANGAKAYVDGAQTAANTFTSLRQQLLSAVNGGDATLFGQTKTLYPYLQSTNILGSDITASNFLDKIFDAWTRHRQLGRSGAADVVMSYKNLGTAMKLLERQSGPYKNVEMKVNIYGWTEITITGVKGTLKFVGVQEMDDDVIYFLDWKGIKLHSNKFFRKQQTPEGLSYFTIRNTTGYVYISDVVFYGELIVNKPSSCGVIYSISY
jgi:hypothetical protein